MRELTLAVLGLASVLLPNVASAQSEWVHVIGGNLVGSGSPVCFNPKRVNIVVTNLPTGWPPHAGQCRTYTHETAPKLRFAFNDGVETSNQLVALGYTLDGDRSGRNVYVGQTYIKLCRDAAGKPAAFTIHMVYYKLAGSVMNGYAVFADNDGAGHGMSSVGSWALSGGAASDCTASSKAVNTLLVRQ